MLIAGKGHEKTQTTREGVAAFDDAQVAQELLNEMGYAGGGRAAGIGKLGQT